MNRILFFSLLLTIIGCATESPAVPMDGPLGKADGIPIDKPENCDLSVSAQNVLDAMLESGSSGLVPDALIASYLNDAEAALVDGQTIFTSLAREIEVAQQEVGIATFVWNVDSEASDIVLQALKTREQSAVDSGIEETIRVRIVVYANKLKGSEEVAKPLVAAVRKLDLDPEIMRVDIATVESVAFGAMHQKLAVVDGRVAHIGGANLEPVHNWTDRVPWHDTAYVVRGEVAHSLLTAFDQTWSEGKTWSCNDSLSCSSFDNVWPSRGFFGVQARAQSCIPMLTLTRRPDGIINNSLDNPQNQGYLAAMDGAAVHLNIETPNINDNAAKAAIKDALLRGVTVRLVTSKGFNERTENLPNQGGGNEQNVEELYDWAKENLSDCDLFQARWYSVDGDEAVVGNGEGASHTKYLSVDDQLVIVGSTNMDTQSWNFSGEVNIVVDSIEVTRDWDRAVFTKDFERGVVAGSCD